MVIQHKQKEQTYMNTKAVLVTTQHRGVFAGLADPQVKATDKSITLTDAKMAIYWGTTKGVMELAHTGPTGRPRISAPATVELADITAIFDITDDAWKVWVTA